jgi:hypothetical protein
MTQTLPLPRRTRLTTRTTADQAMAERMLRDMAYVLHLTERVKRELRTDRPWPVASSR